MTGTVHYTEHWCNNSITIMIFAQKKNNTVILAISWMGQVMCSSNK